MRKIRPVAFAQNGFAFAINGENVVLGNAVVWFRLKQFLGCCFAIDRDCSPLIGIQNLSSEGFWVGDFLCAQFFSRFCTIWGKGVSGFEIVCFRLKQLAGDCAELCEICANCAELCETGDLGRSFLEPSMVLAFDAINGKAVFLCLKPIAFGECSFFPN